MTLNEQIEQLQNRRRELHARIKAHAEARKKEEP